MGSPFGTAETTFATVGLSTFILLLSVLGLAGCISTPWIASVAALSLAAAASAGTVIGSWRPAAAVIWALAAAGFLAIPMITTDVPPYSWDEVAYSAAFPRIYAAMGRVFYSTDLGGYSAFPSSYEALTTAAIKVTGSVVPMRVLGVLCFGAMGAIAACLAAQLTRRCTAAWLAGLFVTAAGVGTYASIVKNDIVNGLLQAAGILLISSYLRQPRMRWALLAGVAFGTSCGVKYTSLQFVLCATTCLLPFVFRGVVSTQRWRHLAAFGAAGLVTGSPWYLRNLVVFHNPFYPFFVSILGDGTRDWRLFAAESHETFYGYAGFSFGQAKPSVFTTLVLQQFGGIPIALAAIGALIIVTQSRRWQPEYRRPAQYLTLLTSVYTLASFFFGLWSPRYFSVLLVCYAALSGVSLAVLFNISCRVGHNRHAVQAALAAALGAALLYQTVDRQRRETGWLVSAVLSGENSADFIRATVNFADVADYINRNLSKCVKITIGLDVQPYYYVNRPYYVMSLLNREFLNISTPDEYERQFREIGLTHIAIQDWLGRDLYIEDKDPVIYHFINGIYGAMRQFEADGRATLLGEVDGLQGRKVRFFRLENGVAPIHCPQPDDERRQ